MYNKQVCCPLPGLAFPFARTWRKNTWTWRGDVRRLVFRNAAEDYFLPILDTASAPAPVPLYFDFAALKV